MHLAAVTLLTMVSSAAAALSYVPSQRQSVGLWPLPAKFSNGSATLTVDAASFAFKLQKPTPTLTAIAKRYEGLIFLHGNKGAAQAGADVKSCSVAVTKTTEVLSYGMDESYTLEVSADGCVITAGTFVGANYAMETLSQLVLSDGGALQGGPRHVNARYTIPDAPWKIEDKPTFVYRGLMVDTARHFLPLNALRRQIDAMSFSKLNTLHWHITDAQSAPLDSTVYPLLKKGAFSEKATYSIADIKALVEYARLRGVQILMELDMPGHNFAWGIGYPELLVNCSAMYPLETEFWTSSFDISRGDKLYRWLEKLLKEVTDVLPNALFHIGGDEVQYQCWDTRYDAPAAPPAATTPATAPVACVVGAHSHILSPPQPYDRRVPEAAQHHCGGAVSGIRVPDDENSQEAR